MLQIQTLPALILIKVTLTNIGSVAQLIIHMNRWLTIRKNIFHFVIAKFAQMSMHRDHCMLRKEA